MMEPIKGNQTSFGIIHILGIVVLISFLLRIGMMSSGPFHPDCLYLAMQSEKSVNTGHIHYLHSHGFPLTAILGAFFVWMARQCSVNDPVLAVNFMNVFFSSLCLTVLFLLMKKLTDIRTAVLTVILFSLSPIYLSNSVYGNSHLPALFLLLGGMVFLLKGKECGSITPLLLSGILLGLAASARLQEVVAAFPVILFLIFSDRIIQPFPGKEKRLRRWLIFVSVVFPAIVMTGAFYQHVPSGGQFQDLRQTAAVYLIKYPFSYLGPWPATFLGAMKHLVVNFSWLGMALSVAGLILLFKNQKSVFWLLLIWVVAGFLMNASLRINVPRFFIFTTIPFYFAQSFLLTRFKAYKMFYIVLAVIVTMVLAERLTYICPIVWQRHRHNLTADYMRWVAQNTEPDAQIIFPDSNPFLSYYGRRTMLGRPLHLEMTGKSELVKFQEKIEQLFEEKIPVYITASGLLSYNPGKMFSDFMLAHYRLESVGVHTIEDWHRGAIYQQVGPEGLFRVMPLKP